jgi:hypothetical protein
MKSMPLFDIVNLKNANANAIRIARRTPAFRYAHAIAGGKSEHSARSGVALVRKSAPRTSPK